MCTCSYACIHMCISACMHTCMHVCACIYCACVCIRVYTVYGRIFLSTLHCVFTWMIVIKTNSLFFFTILWLISTRKLQLPITELGMPQLIQNVKEWSINILVYTKQSTGAPMVTRYFPHRCGNRNHSFQVLISLPFQLNPANISELSVKSSL